MSTIKVGDAVEFIGRERWFNPGKVIGLQGVVIEIIHPPVGEMLKVRMIIPKGHKAIGALGKEYEWPNGGSVIEHLFESEVKKL